jgi:hypothetical protein
MSDPAKIPVIVGAGQVNDRAEGEMALDSLGLMLAALQAADRDGGGGWTHQRANWHGADRHHKHAVFGCEG